MTFGEFFFMLFSAVSVCGGITAATRPNGLLYFWKLRISQAVDDGRLSRMIAYPLILCEACMASLWGTLTFVPLVLVLDIPWSAKLSAYWFIMVCATAWINLLLWTIIHAIGNIRDHYGHLVRDQIRRAQEGQRPDPQR